MAETTERMVCACGSKRFLMVVEVVKRGEGEYYPCARTATDEVINHGYVCAVCDRYYTWKWQVVHEH